MFECDVKLSSDGVPFLLHDDSLTRTTNASEKLGANSDVIGGNHPWGVLAQLDAGSWHSRRFAGEPLPTLEAIARYCLRNAYCLNIEIKPTPGLERQTGEVVARHAAQHWQNACVPPLLTSFDVPALEAALAAQPELPRGLLLEALWPGWLETAQRLGCVAIICDHVLWDQVSVTQAKNAGFKALSYTVNDEATARCLLDLGLDGLITDRVDVFVPVNPCA
jgi:glycerophosphoryl diester phosphodiesterase